jgi:hypothetical protein
VVATGGLYLSALNRLAGIMEGGILQNAAVLAHAWLEERRVAAACREYGSLT